MTYTGTITLAYRANGGTFDVNYTVSTRTTDYDADDGIDWIATDNETGHELCDDDFIDYYGDWIREQILEEMNSL